MSAKFQQDHSWWNQTFFLALNFSSNFSCLHPYLTSKLLKTHHLPGVRMLGCRGCATLFIGKLFCLPLWRQNQRGSAMAVTALPGLCSEVPSWSTLPLRVGTHTFSIPLFETTRGVIPSHSLQQKISADLSGTKKTPIHPLSPKHSALFVFSEFGGTVLHK